MPTNSSPDKILSIKAICLTTSAPFSCFYPHLKCLSREGNGTPLQYSFCLENPSHGWRSLVGCGPGVTKSQTRLNNFAFIFHFHAWGKEMATHSSILAWRISGMVEPGGLPSMGSHRVGHDWSDLAVAKCLSPLFLTVQILAISKPLTHVFIKLCTL